MKRLRKTETNVAALSLLLLAGCGGADSAHLGEGSEGEPGVQRAAISTENAASLFITATSVVNDPSRTSEPCTAVAADANKVWTIGHILTKEAAKSNPVVTPATYASNWMNTWNTTVSINGQSVQALKGRDVLNAWHQFAGSNTTLPLQKAPFRLLSIVNRIDLRKHRPFGEPLGGEIRFIFGIYSPDPGGPACPLPQFAMDPNSTIIVEYSPNKADENQVKDLATRWRNLRNLTGSAYLSALQVLTEEVINSGKLLHIRTNEFPQSPATPAEPDGWNMAEFAPDSHGVLRRTILEQSPTMALSGGTSTLLGNFIWQNRDPLFANAFDFELTGSGPQDPIGEYVVPDKFAGTNTWFRGSINEMGIANDDDFWNAPTPSGADGLTFVQARFRFSIGTCRGCHGRDTATGFNHVAPAQLGQEAFLSAFVSGPTDVEDAVLPGFFRSFDEMTRRAIDQDILVFGGAVRQPVFGNNYTLRFVGDSKCLDSAGNNTTEGAFSQAYDCHGNANQRLSLVSVGNHVYSLKYKHSGKCLDIQNGSTASGARVIQATCNSSRGSQKLLLDSFESPTYRLLRFQHSNLCLLEQAQPNGVPPRIIQGACPAVGNAGPGFQFVE